MTDTTPLAGFLASIPLLRGLPADAIARFARRMPPPRVFRPRAQPALIYDEGDSSTALYLVVDGAVSPREAAAADASPPVVQVSIEDDNLAARVRLWKVYLGDHFGEFEYLAGSEAGRFPVRLTKAVALSACRVLEVPFKTLDELIVEHPIVFRRLARDAIARFQQTIEDTLAAKVSDPDIALALWICERARDFGIREGNTVRFRKTIAQEEIGRDLGVTRETISLRLNEWRRRGLIAATRGPQFVVRDIERVERIAALSVERSRDEHSAAVANVDAALARGDNFRARNFALDVLNYFPGSVSLKHRAVLAVARCGATREALSMLERFGLGRGATPEHVDRVVRSGIAEPAVASKPHYDSFDLEEINERIAALGEASQVAMLVEDILALTPRLLKDLAFENETIDIDAAQEAYARYREAFDASSRPYTGINAASLAFVLGLTDEAHDLAQQVLEKLGPRSRNYWSLATKGEALLLRGDATQAAENFEAALHMPDAFEGSVAATRLQLRRLARANLPAAADMADILKGSSVGCYVGTPLTDNTAGLADDVDILANSIRDSIRQHRLGHLHGGLAAGSDLIIAEAALAENVPVHVVLPLPVDDYLEAAVLPADAAQKGGGPGRSWRDRFEDCLSRVTSLTVLGHKASLAGGSEAALFFGHRHAAGQALLRADTLLAPCKMIAVGNGKSVGGGPVQALKDWQAAGFEPIIVDCQWPAAPYSSASANNPFRPVIFVWLVTEGKEGHLSARGIAEESVAAAEGVIRSLVDQSLDVLRRSLGGNRPQQGLVLVPASLKDAIEIAERLRHAPWPAGIATQITLDFGPAVAFNGRPHEERLKNLDASGGPLEVPQGIVVASAAFAVAARFVLGSAIAPVALGRVTRLQTAGGAVQLLPSTEIYALRNLSIELGTA